MSTWFMNVPLGQVQVHVFSSQILLEVMQSDLANKSWQRQAHFEVE